MIKIRRVYEPAETGEGQRFFVERLWPRGVKKEALGADAWLKEVAPSPALRQWFSHDPDKWEEFSRRYRAELDAHPEAWRPILEAAAQGDVTLLYAAKDSLHNSALLLKEYLQEHLNQKSLRVVESSLHPKRLLSKF
jgi:uncharacterized protein YeaO (DUF488 family)